MRHERTLTQCAAQVCVSGWAVGGGAVANGLPLMFYAGFKIKEIF